MLKSKKVVYVLASLILSFIPHPNLKAAENTSPVVVELFTSQSCSSCPAADKVLGKLAEDPNIITLGYHVTYWNHLSWKDTLSMQASTDLQHAFNGERNSTRIYTPQMVVNGKTEFVGSDLDKALNETSKASIIQNLNVQKTGKNISVSLPEGFKNADGHLTLMLLGVRSATNQDIAAGENAGRSVDYVTPVQSIAYVPFAGGQATPIEITTADQSAAKYVVILREGKAGPILAAGKI